MSHGWWSDAPSGAVGSSKGGRKLEEQAKECSSREPGFCIVSMATLPMSYQIITLSSPTLLLLRHLVALTVVRLPLIHPRFGETTEEGLVERGYKAMVTSCWFLTTYGTVVYALVTFTHYILEGRHGTFNSLFKGMKNSREVERAARAERGGRRNFLCRLRFPLFPTFVSSSYLSREICQYKIILKLFQNYKISPFASNIKLFYSRQLIFSL